MKKFKLPTIKFSKMIMTCLLSSCLFAWGCATMPNQPVAKVTHGQGQSLVDVKIERYNGPKARVAVGDFQVKAAGATMAIGDGLREMLVTGLFNTNRFIVLERQAIQDVMLEQDMGASGRVQPRTAAPTGQIEGAEILVYGVVSEFEANASGGGINLGFTAIPLSLGGGAKNAHMAIDVRVVDTTTGRILSASRVEGKATDYSANLGTFLDAGGIGMPVSLGAYSNTPMEKAIRVCIDRAVQDLCYKTPAQYFHYQ